MNVQFCTALALSLLFAFSAAADASVTLARPQYRGNFYPGQNADVVSGRLALPAGGTAVLTLEGPGFPTRKAEVANGGTFSFDTAGCEVGGVATLTVAANAETNVVRIRRLAETGHEMTWIEDGHLVVNGSPVFRRDIYAEYYMTGDAYKARYAKDRESFLLTDLGSVGIEMSRIVKSRDLEKEEATQDVRPSKILFDAIDEIIEANRANDFGCYYICDEPECRNISPVYLKYIYDYVAEKDPCHVIATATRGGKDYLPCADLLETHPYLNPHVLPDGTRAYGRHPNEVGGYIDAFEPELHPDKCIGFLPTSFSYRDSSLANDYPTFDEYELHVWAALLRGAKTLWPFGGLDMGDRPATYEGVRYMFENTAALERLLLFGSRTDLERTGESERGFWTLGDERVAVILNYTSAPVTADLSGLPDGEWREFRGARAFRIAGGAADRALEIGPLGALVAVPAVWTGDADLRSRASVTAAVAEGEAVRTGRDSQILERYADLTFTSNLNNLDYHTYKLIDGIRDVTAGYSSYMTNAFVEIAVRGAPLAFDRLRFYGIGLETAQARIRLGGEWTLLTPSSRTVVTNGISEWLHELRFDTTNRSVRIRLEFPGPANRQNRRELYEIEIPRVGSDVPPYPEGDRLPDVGVETRWDSATAVLGDSQSSRNWYRGRDVQGDLALLPHEDGSFTYAVTDGNIGRYLTLTPESEWMVADFAAMDPLAGSSGYRYWAMQFADEFGRIGKTVTNPQAGVYTIRLPHSSLVRQHYVAFYNQRLDIRINHISVMHQPATRILVEAADDADTVRPGGWVRVEAHFAYPAVDVEAEWLVQRDTGNLSPYRVNGTSGIDLRRLDDAGYVWGTTVPVDTLAEAADKRCIYVRATPLGSREERPVFSNFLEPFSPEAQPSPIETVLNEGRDGAEIPIPRGARAEIRGAELTVAGASGSRTYRARSGYLFAAVGNAIRLAIDPQLAELARTTDGGAPFEIGEADVTLRPEHPSLPGFTYAVESSHTPVFADSRIEGLTPGNGERLSLSAERKGSTRFYRLKVSDEP